MKRLVMIFALTALVSTIALAAPNPCCKLCAGDACWCKSVHHAVYDFTQWPLPGWVDAREERFPTVGHWVTCDKGTTNFIPADADEKGVVAMKDGLGMAS